MIRHIIIAAWRNMMANRLTSAIAILGLAVGLAAALLMALVVRNQFTFDSFVPLPADTYLAASPPHPTLPLLDWTVQSDYRTADFLKRHEPAVINAARLAVAQDAQSDRLQHGQTADWETVYWADPNIFDLLPLPVLYGGLATALTRPDGIVLPLSMARKYFGHDDVVGQTILLSGHPMLVRAVIADLPESRTTLKTGIFASGSAAFSRLASPDLPPMSTHWNYMEPEVYTYVRLRPGANLAAIEQRVAAHYAPVQQQTESPLMKLLPLAQVNVFEPLHPGIGARMTIASLTGLLILLIAAINFVNLTVARSARREREVGVRKACGAGRGALAVQFVGEAMLAVTVAGLIAISAGEWLLPLFNAFLQTGARLDGSDPAMIFYLLLALAGLGMVTSAYPAFVLAGFRPVFALRGWSHAAAGSGLVRTLLVTLQFAILVMLAIAAWVTWQQRQFALHAAAVSDADQMLILRLSRADAPFPPRGTAVTCAPPLMDALRRLPDVRGVACSNDGFLSGLSHLIGIKPKGGGQPVTIGRYSVDPALLGLYDVKPLAGHLDDSSGTVINKAASRLLGFAAPEAAIGQSWLPMKAAPYLVADFGTHSVITAVIPDFAFYSVEKSIEPALLGPWMGGPGELIHVRLDGHHIPQTLAAIDRAWGEANMKGPENRIFLGSYLRLQYLEITRETTLFAICTGIAILLACLGLFGIAVSTAERRTKEIGVRKAMGAGDGQVVALLLWQFAQPVLWANVIAWPAAWWLMRQWLAGFAYHVDLHWWVFAGASLGALTVALLTVAGQAWMTARQKPVLALRYE